MGRTHSRRDMRAQAGIWEAPSLFFSFLSLLSFLHLHSFIHSFIPPSETNRTGQAKKKNKKAHTHLHLQHHFTSPPSSFIHPHPHRKQKRKETSQGGRAKKGKGIQREGILTLIGLDRIRFYLFVCITIRTRLHYTRGKRNQLHALYLKSNHRTKKDGKKKGRRRIK